MPQVSEFYGIAVYLYYDDHPEPHFHAIYGRREVQIRISDLSVMSGDLQPRAMGLVVEWAAQHLPALAADWRLAEQHLPLKKIPPLR